MINEIEAGLTFLNAHFAATCRNRRRKVMGRDDELLLKMEQQIRSNAFKEETFADPYKNLQGATCPFNALTHVYVLNTAHRKRPIPIGYRAELKNVDRKNGCIINLAEKELQKILDQNRACEEFIRSVASILFQYRHAKKEFLVQIEQSTIDDTRRFLESQIYGKRAINAAMKILKKDLNTQIKKNINYFYPPLSKKQKPPNFTKDHEDEALCEIYSLYEQYIPNLKKSNKRANMAFIIAATDFWKNDREFIKRVKLYFERLRNRIEVLEESDDTKVQASLTLPDGKIIPLEK
jgi:hypothetical protein